MCGIAGEISFDGRADLEAVKRIGAALKRRGPDGHGAWSHRGVAFAHRRLEIIDLSPAGAQPMTDAELGLTIVFNGCIYNYRELREMLIGLGYSFVSTSDTEVLLKAYHRWGLDFVDRLVGMFAFAIAEHESGRVVLGRDRLGIKPLYLAEVDGALRFASELPALLEGGGIDTAIDPIALNHYLSFHAVVPPPHTILAGVRKLEPGTLVELDPDGTRRTRRYWEASFERNAHMIDLPTFEWEERILASLRTAVRRRMVADVPVGVLLSGGLDSSLIVALLAEEGQTGLKTFSVGFEDTDHVQGDEFEYSDLIAREFATEHTQIRISNERMLPALEEAIHAMSEPMTSHDNVGFFLLSQEISKHLKVVQTGQGADEVFAGYDWYPPLADAARGGASEYIREFVDRSPDELAGAIQAEHRGPTEASVQFVNDQFAREGAASPVDRALRLDTEVMLVDDPVKRVDNMTMAWGLEARTPFLDHDLVELAGACPPAIKLAHEGKGVVKRAARGHVPDAVIDRDKGYFPVPALIQLEGPYLELVADALTGPAARQRGLFEPEYVDALLADPNGQRTPLGSNKLWQLGLLELWLQSHAL
jgi:asparagine synthase (glutamine-hydrolysing)